MDKKDAEFAVLEVAFLFTALDGSVDESERAMFDRLAAECKNLDVDQAKVVLRRTDKAVKRLLAAYQRLVANKKTSGTVLVMGRLAQEAFIRAFMDEVDKICDWADFARSSERVRKAFAMWISMCLADGDYSEMERKGMSALQKKLNGYRLIDNEYLATVEKTVSTIQAAEKKIESAASLEASRKLHERQDKQLATLASMIAD